MLKVLIPRSILIPRYIPYKMATKPVIKSLPNSASNTASNTASNSASVIDPNIIKNTATELENIMTTWCKNSQTCSGGEMRCERGDTIEKFVRDTINEIGKQLNKNIRAVKGSTDKKQLKLQVGNKEIKKEHQVDIHIYVNDIFSAVIECKAYLDSCFYIRACDDFKLYNKFGYNVKSYIFTLEDSLSEDTKIFTDHVTDYVCDDVFYILDGKRSSSKPIYEEKYRKPINQQKLKKFIEFIYNL
jgi:hypothetical protein